MIRLRLQQATAALAGTRGFSDGEQQAIIELVREQAIWSQPVETTYAAVLRDIGPREFEWPEFDGWQAVFARCGVFPPSWQGLEHRVDDAAPRPARHAYQARKLHLLIDWLNGLVATRAELRVALRRYALRGLRAEFARQTAAAACPACDAVNHAAVHDASPHVPPFHPGCRCLILAIHPSRSPAAP